MTYTTGIPRSGQSLGNSKPQVQGNFDYINTAFAVNHIAFNTSGVGRHKFCDFVEVGQTGNPTAPTPPTGVDSLFTQATTIPLGELFYQRGTGGPPNTPIQMTNGDPTNASTGVTFLPGGLLMQWGLVTLNGSGQAINVPFSPTFKLAGVNTSPWSIQVTFANTTFSGGTIFKTVATFNPHFNNFSIGSAGGANEQVFWLAIGPRT